MEDFAGAPELEFETVSLDEVREVAGGDAFRRIEDRELLARLLQVCTPRQERVLRLSSGIGCASMTAPQIATSLNLTRQQIRNLRDNALVRMRIEAQLMDDPVGEVEFEGEVYRAGWWRQYDAAYRNLRYIKAVGREAVKSAACRRGREFQRQYEARQALRRAQRSETRQMRPVLPAERHRQEELLDRVMMLELVQLIVAMVFMVLAPYAGFVEYGRAGAVMCFAAGMAVTYAIISLTARALRPIDAGIIADRDVPGVCAMLDLAH